MMMVLGSQPVEEEFIEAQKNWELEKLYLDLASAKRKALTPLEKKFLRGLLCGCSPAEIANRVYQSRSSSTVRVYLSNGLYKYIEDMLSTQAGYSVKVKNWSHVTHLLEKAGYKKSWIQLNPIVTLIKDTQEQETELIELKSPKIQDWGEAVDVSGFCGRTTELATVSDWILQQRCRLVVLLGMGGIGKTAFSIKLAEGIQDQFEYVIWRSLHLCPSIDVILSNIMQILSPTLEIDQTATLNSRISQLIQSLRNARCLLVLDHVDSILSSADGENTEVSSPTERNTPYVISQIRYRPGYEGYGELIRRVGDSQHQSCLLLTSRQKPPEIAAIEGKKLPVRSVNLTGLSKKDSLVILKAKGFAELQYTECSVLIDYYAGNPLFLKLVATTIQDLFGGSIYEFLEQGTLAFGDIRRILDQQFHPLSELETSIIYWLALNPDCASMLTVPSNIIPGLSPRLAQRLILETIELLQRRSLIEKAKVRSDVNSTAPLMNTQVFCLSPGIVFRDYVIERLMEENFKSHLAAESNLLLRNPILAAQLKIDMKKSIVNSKV